MEVCQGGRPRAISTAYVRYWTDAKATEFLVDRYPLPMPRVELGPRLTWLASAELDVSDGLVADLRHLCEVSQLMAVVEASRVPLSAAARAVCATEPGRIATVLTGGAASSRPIGEIVCPFCTCKGEKEDN